MDHLNFNNVPSKIEFSRRDFDAKILSLQQEAKGSEKIISEIAGLEKYISETYTSRVFYELIQNADDCKSSQFESHIENNDLYFFNDGRQFTLNDLESICRSAFSTKTRGESIGYRGIGFKSVAGVCDAVSIVSGELEVHFSKESTKKLLGFSFDVPLLRVPHSGLYNENETDAIRQYLELNGHKTCFILHNANEDQLISDLRGVTENALIFLNNLEKIKVTIGESSKDLRRSIVDTAYTCSDVNNMVQYDDIIITKAHGDSEAKCTDIDKDIDSITAKRHMRRWRYKNIGLCTDLESNKPIRLKNTEAYAQAFLPMISTTGLGVIVNGDFSTDPSRTRINPDENTKEVISIVVELLSILLIRLSSGELSTSDKELLECMIPYRNSQVFDISPSYISEGIITISSQKVGQLNSFKNFCLQPPWMSSEDYIKYCQKLNKNELIFNQLDAMDCNRSLGAGQCSSRDALEFFIDEKPSVKTASCLIENILSGTKTFKYFEKFDIDFKKINILITEKGYVVCADDLVSNNLELDAFQANMILTKLPLSKKIDLLKFYVVLGLKESNIPNSLISILEKQVNNIRNQEYFSTFATVLETRAREKEAQAPASKGNFVSAEVKQPDSTLSDFKRLVNDSETVKNTIYPLPMSSHANWRKAELLAADLFKSQGMIVEDVSKQNRGYDLELRTDEGVNAFVEVKLLRTKDEEFRLTDNEIYVAREKKEQYWILLLIQPDPNDKPNGYALVRNFYDSFVEYFERRCLKYEMICTGYTLQYNSLI